jgi:hypothetical protein
LNLKIDDGLFLGFDIFILQVHTDISNKLAASFSEIFVSTCSTAQSENPDDYNVHDPHCKNLKIYVNYT